MKQYLLWQHTQPVVDLRVHRCQEPLKFPEVSLDSTRITFCLVDPYWKFAKLSRYISPIAWRLGLTEQRYT